MPRLIASILMLFLICFSNGCGPSKNTATASLRLTPAPGSIGPEGEFTSLDSFFQTQIDLLCSETVLVSASSELLRSKTKNPVLKADTRSQAADWQSRLWVSRSKDSQIINVYFDGASPEASIEILDAIVSAFAEYSTERDHARKDGGRV